jgi:hypothetical protein
MRGAAVLTAVMLLSGCGSERSAAPGQPRLPHALAGAGRHAADGVAAALAVGDGCLAQQRAAALQRSVIEAINARRVVSQFQEPLQSAVNDLRGRIRCTPPPPPPPAPAAPPGHDHGKPKGHDKGDD